MSTKLTDKYLNGFVGEDEYKGIEAQVKNAHKALHDGTGLGNDFIGWVDLPTNYDKEEFARIKKAAEKIKNDTDVFVVIGIGGSYLGARAAIEFLTSPNYNALCKDTPQIYFTGNSISSGIGGGNVFVALAPQEGARQIDESLTCHLAKTVRSGDGARFLLAGGSAFRSDPSLDARAEACGGVFGFAGEGRAPRGREGGCASAAAECVDSRPGARGNAGERRKSFSWPPFPLRHDRGCVVFAGKGHRRGLWPRVQRNGANENASCVRLTARRDYCILLTIRTRFQPWARLRAEQITKEQK